MGEGRHAEGLVFFREADRLYRNPRVLRAIGFATDQLGQYADSYEAVRTALDTENRPGIEALTNAEREEMGEFAERVRLLAAQLSLDVPEETTVFIDGEPRDATGVILLNPGHHEIRAERPRHSTWRREISPAVGESLALAVELDPEADSASSDTEESDEGGDDVEPREGSAEHVEADLAAWEDESSAPATAPEPNRGGSDDFVSRAPEPVGSQQPREDRDARHALRPVFITSGLLLVAASAVAVGLGFDARTEIDNCSTPDAGFICSNRGELLERRRRSFASASVLGGTGLLLTVVGALLRSPSTTEISGCTPGLGELTCTVTF